MKISTSTLASLMGEVRSPMELPRYNPGLLFCDLSVAHAIMTVFCVAIVAWLFISTPSERMSDRPKMWDALAVTKARTTPDPVPISVTIGDGVVGGKCVVRNAVSVEEERVSRRR